MCGTDGRLRQSGNDHAGGWIEAIVDLARGIGEDILIDLPVARDALNL